MWMSLIWVQLDPKKHTRLNIWEAISSKRRWINERASKVQWGRHHVFIKNICVAPKWANMSCRTLEYLALGRMFNPSAGAEFSRQLCPQGAWHYNGAFRRGKKLSAIHNAHWGNTKGNLINLKKFCLALEYFLLHPAVVPAMRKLNPNMQTMTKIVFSRWPCWCCSVFTFLWVKGISVCD